MNRQQALNQLRLMQAWHEDFGNGPNADYDAICYAIGVIEEMPEGTDSISRKQAIDALKQQADTMSEWSERYAEQRKGVLTAVNIVEDLPPAQPEIIRCKDCKFNPKYEWFRCPMSHLSEKQRPETAWCWKAERRTDGID